MEATNILIDEHRVIERVLVVLESAASRLGSDQMVRPGFFIDAAEFIKGFADGCHHKKEEGVLFPAMEAAGVPRAGGPIGAMLADHEAGRVFTRNMRAAAERLASGDKLAALEVERNALDYVIVSDAGKPFEINERPTEAGSAVLLESIDILMEQVRGLQFKRLELNAHAEGGCKPVWFSIDSKEGQAQSGDAAFASAIRTHLKRLSEAEIEVLTRHSAALLKHRFQTYTPELLAV